MKKFLQLLCVLIFATPWVSAQNPDSDRVRFYVQPSAIVAYPGDDFDTVGGVSVAAGVTFARNHSVELEYLGFETERRRRWSEYELEFEYLFAAYKYRFAITEKFSVQAGVFLGRFEQKMSPAEYGTWYYNPQPDDDFAGGLSGTVEYQFTPHISFVGGIKMIGQAATRFTTSGTVGVAQAGAKFSF
ncbi:hypothetical protein CMV30_09810 [Nibricoccus aquaticus]|uniref:Outer membrane protein beta-barrel domain-containing protein n=1 Tax=Nibricoccus aquaticus TaxID=2576891 RepID=A0A290QFW4_9BACT|nr:outer membrane beta-barrel protein [Nibricoccus aquaticus]ATC64228.1 hypothetical protein CMV30_09810 [Nibricoccus aquaticus]